MRFYQHKITKNDLFILIGDVPEWLNTHVDGRHSRDERTPMYCRLVPSGEIALVHIVKWVYADLLTATGEEEARILDNALFDRIAGIERGEETPQLVKRTKYYASLKERGEEAPPAPSTGQSTDPPKS